MKTYIKFIFIITMLFIINQTSEVMSNEWFISLKAYPGDRSYFNTLSLGTAEEGSAGFDVGLDVPTFAPPSGFYAYFPLDDTASPYITMLGTDIRGAFDDSLIWIIRHGGDFSPDPRKIEWDRELIPGYTDEEHYMYIGAAYPGLEVEDWLAMDSQDSITCLAGQEIYIKYYYYDKIDQEYFNLQNKYFMVNIFPNPFNSQVDIEYFLAQPEEIKIEIWDISGKKIINLYDGIMGNGWNKCSWNGRDRYGKKLSTGIYFCSLATKSFTNTKKIAIIK